MYYIRARPSFPLRKGSGYETRVHSAIDARCTFNSALSLTPGFCACMWLCIPATLSSMSGWGSYLVWPQLALDSFPGQPKIRETVRIVLARSDGEDRCSRSVSSVSLAAVGRPGATAVLHPERGQRLIKPRGRWATTTSVCVYPPVQHLARYWSFSRWSPPPPTSPPQTGAHC